MTNHTKALRPHLQPKASADSQGFTLVEVLVALVIFGASTLALTFAMSETMRSHRALESRHLAQWIANNTVNELTLLPDGAALSGNQSVSFGHREWLVTWSQRSLLQSYAGAGLQQIQLSVSSADNPEVAIFTTLAVIGTQ